MKRLFAAALVAGGMFAGSAGAASAAEWTCTAKDLRSGSYSGGAKARIHLKGYSSGGSYAVKKVNAKKVTGTTKDGTKFTCTTK